MARDGKSAIEIAQKIEQLKPLVRAGYVVDTLVYLHRGGRCSALSERTRAGSGQFLAVYYNKMTER